MAELGISGQKGGILIQKDKYFYFYYTYFQLGVWNSIRKILNREEANVIYFCQRKKSLEKVNHEFQLSLYFLI